MDYNDRKNLIEELQKSMTGKEPEEKQHGKIVAKYNTATKSTYFVLSGTEYTVEDVCRAKKYLEEKRGSHVKGKSERYKNYDIALECMETIISEFTDAGAVINVR